MGEWDQAKDHDCEEDECSDDVMDIPVAEQIPHDEYAPGSKQQQNDIALLRLQRKVNFSYWVKPICLPVASHQRGKNFNHESLEVSGWGKTETGEFIEL